MMTGALSATSKVGLGGAGRATSTVGLGGAGCATFQAALGGAGRATSKVGLGGSASGSPRTTPYSPFPTRFLCKAISAPFKGPLNPFPFKDKVFTCHCRIRLLLPQQTIIDETYGWNYV